MAENHLMNLPASIITDILARLPPKNVLQCRSVCKAWLHLLCQPEFVDLHLSKSPTCLIVNRMYSSPPNSASFCIVEVKDESRRQGVRYIARMNREIPKSRPNIGVTIIGSIDGLVCINEFSYGYELIHVWNPITAEFISVQPAGGAREYPNVITYGFGISSGKYHVVRIFQEIRVGAETKIQNSTCYVYTIGAGLWRNIGHAPYLYSCLELGLFLNGNLHWLIYDQDKPELISCLDLEKELFQPFPAPPEFSPHLATLNLYNGCLSVCDNTSDFDIVIWVMKEYGVKSSWSKEVVISKYPIDLVGNYYQVVRIIKVFKDGEVLLLWRNDYLFSYHPKTKTVQNLLVQETLMGPSSKGNDPFPSIEAQDYVSSFVSLKTLGEVNVKMA